MTDHNESLRKKINDNLNEIENDGIEKYERIVDKYINEKHERKKKRRKKFVRKINYYFGITNSIFLI